MTCLPKLLYPLQTLALLLRNYDVQKLHKALTLYGNIKKTKIALTKLWRAKGEGGLNLPNAKLYNITCILRHMADWIMQNSQYSNYQLKSAMAAPWSLEALLHTKLKNFPPALKNNAIIRDTVIA